MTLQLPLDESDLFLIGQEIARLVGLEARGQQGDREAERELVETITRMDRDDLAVFMGGAISVLSNLLRTGKGTLG